jgi:uncharacterized membrane protein
MRILFDKFPVGIFLRILFAVVIIVSFSLIVYVFINPIAGEKFTEFYLLDPNAKAENYPQDISVGESSSVIIGLSNHENRTLIYRIQIWLINQTTSFNGTENRSITNVNHMWFLDNITIELEHILVNTDEPWQPQWEYNYTFSLTREGDFKLAFLLYTTPTEKYDLNTDYKDNAEQILKNVYREVYLWITVT